MTEKKADTLATLEVAAISAASTALGFPVPPTLARNFINATGSLVSAAFDVPTAWLEGIASDLRAEAKARAKFKQGAVSAAVTAYAEDEELPGRAARYLGGRMLREQKNRETTAERAAEDLRADPPSADAPTEIDEDWLNVFARLAESRSDETMQAYFGKILSGEIRRPGSFSPSTLEVLSRMGKRDAELFQRLCGLTMELRVPEHVGVGTQPFSPFVLCEPFGAPGSNSLSSFGLSYDRLRELQEAGLLGQDLTAWRPVRGALFLGMECYLGRTRVAFTVQEEVPLVQEEVKAKVLNLTRAGVELHRIAQPIMNSTYREKTVAWIEQRFAVRSVEAG